MHELLKSRKVGVKDGGKKKSVKCMGGCAVPDVYGKHRDIDLSECKRGRTGECSSKC